jgi:hypothetical protein
VSGDDDRRRRRAISAALDREEFMASERRWKFRPADVYRWLLALASLISLVGVTRFAALTDRSAPAAPCPPFDLAIDHNGGVVGHVCGFIPGVGLLLPVRYDVTLRLQIRADHDSSANSQWMWHRPKLKD